MSEIFVRPREKSDSFNTDPPLDKVELADPKKSLFEEDVVFDLWGYYPFLYESERTVQLGGLVINNFGSFGGFSLPPMSFPSFDLIAGSDPAVAIPESQAAPDAGTEATWCFDANGDLIEIPKELEATRAFMCQSVLQPCAFANLYAAQINAMVSANTLVDVGALQQALDSGGVSGDENFNLSPGLSNFTTCNGTVYRFEVTLLITDANGSSNFRTRVEVFRGLSSFTSPQNQGTLCQNASGFAQSCNTVIPNSLASVWARALAAFKTDFEANSGCSNCVVDVDP